MLGYRVALITIFWGAICFAAVCGVPHGRLRRDPPQGAGEVAARRPGLFDTRIKGQKKDQRRVKLKFSPFAGL